VDPKTAVSLAEIYKPIAEDIKRVDGRLRGIVEEALDPFPREFGAFRSMGKRLRPAITLLVNHACRAARAETPQRCRAAIMDLSRLTKPAGDISSADR